LYQEELKIIRKKLKCSCNRNVEDICKDS